VQARRLPDTLADVTFDPGPPRSEGLHVSTIIQSMLRDMDAKKYGSDQDKAKQALFWQWGFAFERVMERAFAENRIDVLRPGELEMDGVYLTPDGVSLDDGANDEIKVTWRSPKGFPYDQKWWNYITQFKAYCRVLGTNTVRVRKLYAVGDMGRLPSHEAWELTFTNDEIEKNWQLLLRHAKQKGML
jgi:hypothetical protein